MMLERVLVTQWQLKHSRTNKNGLHDEYWWGKLRELRAVFRVKSRDSTNAIASRDAM